MARRPRGDHPGAWHHVMNRGLARRAVFEDRACVRYFLSRMAREVRRGEIEVHAYVLMTTHFHLLVRSRRAGISDVMRRIQNLYVRWFNRRSRRDGPLFRSRFVSRLVESDRYRRTLVRYIDKNPVAAKLVRSAGQYPHGSARHYMRGTSPRWLERSWVERAALERVGGDAFSARVYRSAFGAPLRPEEQYIVEARLKHPGLERDPLDDLVGAARGKVERWLLWKARLADGTRPGLPCASAQSVRTAWQHARSHRSEWLLERRSGSLDLWNILLIGLLRDVGGLRWSEIALRAESSEAAARRRYEFHRTQLVEDSEYRRAAVKTGVRSQAQIRHLHANVTDLCLAPYTWPDS